MLSFKKQPKITREAMFNSKPTRNSALEWEMNDDDEACITLRRADTTRVKIISKIFWVPDKRTMVLDQIGTQVWEMCDGKTTVEAMIKRLSTDHKLNNKEAEISLLAYLKQLGQKNLVGFVVDKKDLGKKRRKASGKAWGS